MSTDKFPEAVREQIARLHVVMSEAERRLDDGMLDHVRRKVVYAHVLLDELEAAAQRDTQMPSIWVIEQGEYSNYRVVGVFSSRENADLVTEALNSSETNRYDRAEVSEWALDPVVDQLNAGRRRFLVYMLRDGTVERCSREDFTSSDLTECYIPLRDHLTKTSRLSAEIWATDEHHAVKIANERRTQMIACGEWPADGPPSGGARGDGVGDDDGDAAPLARSGAGGAGGGR